MKKGKNQMAINKAIISLVNSFAASTHGCRIYLLEFGIVLKLKKDKKFQRGNAAAANESTLQTFT